MATMRILGKLGILGPIQTPRNTHFTQSPQKLFLLKTTPVQRSHHDTSTPPAQSVRRVDEGLQL